MRELTSTLSAAQKRDTAVPYVKIEVCNKIAGVVRLDWERLYEGQEDDYFHALTMTGDGSLVRARITPPTDSRKLYRQRVESPGAEGDFSQWVYTGQYNAVVTAAASLGAEVSIFWIKSNREVRRIKSTDNGANWGSPELIDYAATTAIYGLAAAYKPNGDLAIFFADQSNLYVKKNNGGQWQNKTVWNKSTGYLSGVACIYDDDWNLLVTGRDTAGNYKLWSLVYGDGGDVAAGGWSELKELASAPSGGDFEYRQPFLDKPDVFRCCYVEKFTGTEAYSRPYGSHSVPGTSFVDGLWREPAPFNLTSEYGLAMARHGNYGWMASPGGVWRACLEVQNLNLTADVINIRQEVGETSGGLTVELKNDGGKYASPGEGNLAVLDTGCQLEFSPGYVTASGNEHSSGQTFHVESLEHTSAGGKASLIIHARDGWGALSDWRARHQFRWNKNSDDFSVREIIAVILARAGLKLETVTQSQMMTGFYPDFTVNPENSGKAVIQKLLSFVSDLVFIEGNTVYIVNPLSNDESVYSYGGEHRLYEGRYARGAMQVNRVQVEGYDSGLVLADSFDWGAIDRLHDRLMQVEDRNIGAVTEARQRGQAVLRHAEIEAAGGAIIVPVNCGQQLYDVVDITDARAGLDEERKRVLGITLIYSPRRGEYRQRLSLGAV
ncbi:MAG: hypothetical protein JXA51_07620 [Dehalococcoidales bacterium]|nr:hypothetical protein [Dehalococcoidales bacterium]